jgi:hypothetical protein
LADSGQAVDQQRPTVVPALDESDQLIDVLGPRADHAGLGRGDVVAAEAQMIVFVEMDWRRQHHLLVDHRDQMAGAGPLEHVRNRAHGAHVDRAGSHIHAHRSRHHTVEITHRVFVGTTQQCLCPSLFQTLRRAASLRLSRMRELASRSGRPPTRH